jgi:hypothetical protein
MFPDRRVVATLWPLAALVAGAAGPARAQVALTLSQTPNVFPAPAVADYDAGVVLNPRGIVYTVNVTGGSAFTTRTTTVSIRASSASLGNGKPVSDLKWRRSDQPTTWHAMTTADAVVESRQVRKNRLNDPWSNTVFLQMALSWASDPPATYTTGLVFTLTVTTP